MKTYGFTHYGNGIHLRKYMFEGHSPKVYITVEKSDAGWNRVVASAGDAYRNDFNSYAEAMTWLKGQLN